MQVGLSKDLWVEGVFCGVELWGCRGSRAMRVRLDSKPLFFPVR